MQAKDAMNTDVISCHHEITIREAVELLRQHRITSMPVVNLQAQLVGIISESRLLEALFNAEDPDQSVSSFTTKPVLTVEECDPLLHVIMLSLSHNIRQIPVMQHGRVDGRLVGIVNRRDMLRMMLEAKQHILWI